MAYHHRQLNLSDSQYAMLQEIAKRENRSISDIARIFLDAGFSILAGDMFAAERCISRIHCPAPAYQPENDPH
jgi:hypothetical protein